jgi:predicted dehydrogenase
MERPRIAVVGTGWWATSHHIPSLLAHPGAELVAVVDRDRGRLSAVLDHYELARGFADLDELVSAGIADAVIIATPHDTHYPLARRALDAGLHVLVEKPMTVAPEDAWDLVQRAADRERHLVVGYTAQYGPSAAFLRDSLREGALGELLAVSGIVATMIHPLLSGDVAAFAGDSGFPVNGPNPDTYSDPQRAGGGFVITQLTHTVGMLLYATGLTATRVFAETRNVGLDIETSAAVLFTLEERVTGTLTGSGAMHPGQREFHQLRFYGTEATAFQDLLAGEVRLVSKSGAERVVGPVSRRDPVPNRAPARAFAELIAGRGVNCAPGVEAARAVALIDAIYRSARAGQVIDLAAERREHGAPEGA